jgi:alkylation response protein AidB-like acyl-CoA dehydrogenase
MDADELRLFEASLRQAIGREPAGIIDAALADVGWTDALGHDPTVAAAGFGIQGELNVTSSALDDVVIAALGHAPAPTTAVILPPLGSHTPGPAGAAIQGFGTRRLAAADTAIVIVRRDDGDLIGSVEAAALQRRTVAGVDPAGGWVEVTADLTATDLTPVAWNDAVTAAQRAVARELAAASRAMLALARDHAVDRIQFGRPISGFQAVRHRLAESLVAVEAADAAVAVAFAEPSLFASAMAKAIAGRSARSVARHAQQVLAGMGFTSEHPFHRYLRRTMVLDQLFGSAESISTELGEAVLAARQVPALLAL